MLCETTISGFVGSDENGTPEFVRLRSAIPFPTPTDDDGVGFGAPTDMPEEVQSAFDRIFARPDRMAN